jgi:hypothetical protein
MSRKPKAALPEGAEVKVVHLEPEDIERLRQEKGNVVYESGRRRAEVQYSGTEDRTWLDWIREGAALIWAEEDKDSDIGWEGVAAKLAVLKPEFKTYRDNHPKLVETLCQRNPPREILQDLIFFEVVRERIAKDELDRKSADMIVGKYLLDKYRCEFTEEQKQFMAECQTPAATTPSSTAQTSTEASISRDGYQVRPLADVTKLPEQLEKRFQGK